MNVYLPGSRGSNRYLVTPGREFPTSEFVDATGAPIVFTVEFRAGRAEVPDNLGRYMIDKGMAQRSAILLPEHIQV